MNRLDNQTTNSTKTSLVFNDTYANGQEMGLGGVVAASNPGVQIKAFGSDEKVKGLEYTATLTWTLADVK